MGLYEHWPYANFHELNLDWIVTEMAAIRKEMEDIREWKSGWEDILEDLNEKYIEIVAKYDQLERDFTAFKLDMEADFDTLNRDFIIRFAGLQAALEADIEGFKNEIQFQVDGLSTEVSALDQKLDRAIDNLADSLRMSNPFTGQEEPLSQIIMQLASFHMADAITAGEYDGLAITAGYYDGLNLTAYQYDIEGKTYLMP